MTRKQLLNKLRETVAQEIYIRFAGGALNTNPDQKPNQKHVAKAWEYANTWAQHWSNMKKQYEKDVPVGTRD